MKILAVETTGPQCSVALLNESGNVTERVSEGTLNHLQNLTPMIGELLSDCQLQIDDVDAIAASQGPGSFTGIRIGVATVRALCQAAGVPAIAVPTLRSFAYHAEEEKGMIVPVFDARRSQVYAGAFVWRDGEIREAVPGGAYLLEEFLAKLSEESAQSGNRRVVLFGDGCVPYGEKITACCEEQGISCVTDGRTQRAGSVVRLARDLFKAGALLEYGQLHPEYMRKAEAERKLEEMRERK